jgi:hypothetical protein
LKDIPVVILGANTLLGDISHGVKGGKHTTLVPGANVGAFRLFAARHVVDEIYEHGQEFAAGTKVDASRFFKA